MADAKIEYGSSSSAGTQIFVANTSSDEKIVEQLAEILSNRFSSGFRLNSPIELMRFRKFCAEDMGKGISLSDEELINYITACGTEFDGKIYAVLEETKMQNKLPRGCSTYPLRV